MSEQRSPEYLQPVDDLGAQLAKSMIRHLSSVTSGVLVAAGVITDDQSTQFIAISTAIGLWLFSQGWSWIRKLKRAAA